MEIVVRLDADRLIETIQAATAAFDRMATALTLLASRPSPAPTARLPRPHGAPMPAMTGSTEPTQAEQDPSAWAVTERTVGNAAYWPPARIELLKHMATVDVRPLEEIIVALNKLPGPEMMPWRVKLAARTMGVAVYPEVAWRRYAIWTGARTAYLETEYPKGTSYDELELALNELPGPPVNKRQIQAKAANMGVFRPAAPANTSQRCLQDYHARMRQERAAKKMAPEAPPPEAPQLETPEHAPPEPLDLPDQVEQEAPAPAPASATVVAEVAMENVVPTGQVDLASAAAPTVRAVRLAPGEREQPDIGEPPPVPVLAQKLREACAKKGAPPLARSPAPSPAPPSEKTQVRDPAAQPERPAAAKPAEIQADIPQIMRWCALNNVRVWGNDLAKINAIRAERGLAPFVLPPLKKAEEQPARKATTAQILRWANERGLCLDGRLNMNLINDHAASIGAPKFELLEGRPG